VPIAVAIDIAELPINGKTHPRFFDVKTADSEIHRPEGGERFVRFDLVVQQRCIGRALVFERLVCVRR